ncbi:MAG: hypothetical protein AUH28_17590 [Acidobacteria bacterium 13_1_40CM_56_16]|nr:MAG: hypothetical protein AUH28_17590 [Acidobacteria bacterium 13_1_40CM_56_16]
MTRAILVGGTIVVAVVLSLGFAGFLTAQTPSSSALTGKVTSQADGAMEGVLIGAKKVGSTISIWVVSNAQGQYSFPRERMGPGLSWI